MVGHLTDRVSIHNVDNLPGQVVVPDLRNRMGEDFAQLLQTALGLRSAGRGPLLLAHSIKQRRLRMQTCICSTTEPPHWRKRNADQECRK